MARAATSPTTPPRLVQLGRRTEVPPELACPELKPACELIVPAITAPEPCVFQSVWSQVDFAILMFDLSLPERRLMWQNDAATALLESLAPHLQHRELLSLLVPEPDKLTCAPRTQRLLELRVGPVVLGYSLYRTSEAHLVVLLRSQFFPSIRPPYWATSECMADHPPDLTRAAYAYLCERFG